MRASHRHFGLTSTLASTLAAIVLATPSALAGGPTVKADIDNRNGTITAFDGGGGDPAEFSWNVDPSEKYDPFNWNQTVQVAGRIATLVHSSQWFGVNPGTATTGFTLSETYTATKPIGAGYATGTEFSTMSLLVQGLGSGQTIAYEFFGSLTETNADAVITLVGPGVNITKNATGMWDQLVNLSNGEYTLTIDVDVLANTSPAVTKSIDLAITLQEDSPPLQCGANAGSCFSAHPSPGCDDVTCCDAVCAIDPTCCSLIWDADCGTLAADTCAQTAASGIVINPANGHRYRLVTPGSWDESRAFSAASTFGETFGCPVSIQDGFENQWIRCTLASNVPGIVGFTGPTDLFISEYLEGSVTANHAIEIFNGTAGSVDLVAGGYKLLVYTNGSATGTAYNLSGIVPAGGTWVVAPSNASAGILQNTDQQLPPIVIFNGDDAIALVKGNSNTPVDIIGQIGFDPGAEWGTGQVSTANANIRRNASVVTGDANGADAFDPALQWSGFGTGDPSNLGMHFAETNTAFSIWTGYNDVAVEGSFKWWCLDPATYTNWLPGEPNNQGNSDFVELVGDSGKWRDRGVNARVYGVTEFEFVLCGAGGSCFGTSATPGCNNESCCHTVCFVDPFCCNAAWDSICVDQAFDLCSPGIAAGPFFNPATGHNYYLLETAAWSEAQKKARSMNGTLAVINDAAENAWVLANVAQFDGNTTRICFLGLHDQVTEGSFQWIDNSFVSYTNWAAGEPNNSGGVEHFAELLSNGTWRDNDNTGTAGFTTYAIVEVGCLGDFDANGMVDGGDLAQILGGWGGTAKDIDLNQDGIIDASDLAAILGAWGPCN